MAHHSRVTVLHITKQFGQGENRANGVIKAGKDKLIWVKSRMNGTINVVGRC